MAKSYRQDIHGKNPYYDDYDPNKKFVRIMSRPGFPLQAREITQAQTILQNQIERFGDHFFEEGASVKGGEIVEASGIAIRLNDTSFTTDELKSFLNKTITRPSDGVSAKIISYADKDNTLTSDSYQILFVNYTTSGSFAAGNELVIKGTLPEQQITLIPFSTNGPPAVATATNVLCFSGGIYYADGFFVRTTADSIGVHGISGGTGTFRTFSNPSASIGFKVKREIISSEEDDTLKDPSFGFYNFNSPGADRYKIDLQLSQIRFDGDGLTFDSEDFFELVRVVQGNTTKKVRYTDYAIFEETLARRTFDESGNYTVRPFQLTPETFAKAFGTSSETQHAVKLEAGKAYVGGYEFETISPVFLSVDRSLDTSFIRSETIKTPLSNYVTILRNSSFDSKKTGGGEREAFTKNKKAIIQREADTGEISNIGSCNIRTIEDLTKTSENGIRLYLFNINMFATGGTNGFANSTHISVDDGSLNDTTQRFRIGNATSDTSLENVNTSRQIFKAPRGTGLIRASGSAGLNSSFLVKRAYQFEIDEGSLSTTIDSPKRWLEGTQRNHTIFYSQSTLSSSSGATMLNVGSDILIETSNGVNNNTLTLSCPSDGSGISGGGKGTIIASQVWENDAREPESNIRIKQLVTTGSVGGKTGSASTGIIYMNHADVYSLTNISDSNRDVTSSFDLDVNSSTDAYRTSRIILKAGATCETNSDGDIVINSATYSYFSHSGDGPFTVDSYPITDTFTYDDIPDFIDTETGEKYNLADAYDFRPIATNENEDSFDNGSGGAQVVAFENGIIPSRVSYEHYLSRIDSIVLGVQERDFRIVKGVPAIKPKAPEIEPTDMNLGDLNIPPYTRFSTDIRYRYIDNQRTTMTELNEQETAQQFDQYFNYKNDLEQEALNRAQNFRSSRTAFSDGIFVDTFLGHNNTITSKRDHNCSIDPEFGELRPAFESNFLSMGFTAAELGPNTEKTTDNIYLASSESTPYTSNFEATNTISANQFSVADYLGTVNLSPSSDNFFDVQLKPKVVVNTIGEVDNWETSIAAFQRGRNRGFGSQWRDWETLWFGSRKRNDVNIEHDSAGGEYTNPRRSSYVSRLISDKLIKKIGNRIVDLSVVPFARSREISYSVKNLKPNTKHYISFDGASKGFLETDASGATSGTFPIQFGVHSTGKKLFRVADNAAGSLPLASSSADGTYYAEGLLETKEGDSFSIRPAITRRKASNVEDVSSDYYESNSKDNLSRSYNSQTPFAQELFVDPTNFPNGIMLKDIDLFFASLPSPTSDSTNPVKVHIRPMYNGAPHPYKVLPFSEVTKTDISTGNFESTEGTKFTFSTPVYLKPNTTYAVCISSNDDYKLYYAEENSFILTGNPSVSDQTNRTAKKPTYMGRMFIPSNNGSYQPPKDQYLKMSVNRCNFEGVSTDEQDTQSEVIFTTSGRGGRPFHVLYAHVNDQLTDRVKTVYKLTSNTVSGGSEVKNPFEVNLTTDDFSEKQICNESRPIKISARFNTDSTKAICSMIDGDRLGVNLIEYMANNDDSAAVNEENQPTARLATNRSRYISRKVTLEKAADDIVVMVDGSYVGNSQIKVYVKLQGPDTAAGVFDDNDYIELFPEGNATLPVSGKFAELKPEGDVGGVMRFTTNNLLPGTSEFTAYQIKILLMGENVNNEGNATQIPVLNTISAVPLRRLSQDEIRRYTPPGSVFSWSGGGNAPFGFVYCDGSVYNAVENPEFKVLFEAIGTRYNKPTDPTPSDGSAFRVPDLRGRMIVGTGTPNPAQGSGLNRTLAEKGGEDETNLTRDQLPPHTHNLGAADLSAPNMSFNSGGYGSSTRSSVGNERDAIPICHKGSGLYPTDDDDHGKGGFANVQYVRPLAGPEPDIFNLMPDSMAGNKHNNMPPFLVLDYIIKI